jgi:hypothetical protein
LSISSRDFLSREEKRKKGSSPYGRGLRKAEPLLLFIYLFIYFICSSNCHAAQVVLELMISCLSLLDAVITGVYH